MKLPRYLSILLTTPVWLLAGVCVVLVSVPLAIATFIVAVIEYGFTGEWDWII